MKYIFYEKNVEYIGRPTSREMGPYIRRVPLKNLRGLASVC